MARDMDAGHGGGAVMINKDRVTELVIQSGLHEFGFGHDRERFMTALAYFATALQHEALKAAKREDVGAEQTPMQWWDGEGNLKNLLWDTEVLRPKGGLMIDPKVAAVDCHTTFIGNSATEVLRISAEGIWANPDVPVDEIAHVVLSVLDNQIKTMVKNAVDAARMEAGL